MPFVLAILFLVAFLHADEISNDTIEENVGQELVDTPRVEIPNQRSLNTEAPVYFLAPEVTLFYCNAPIAGVAVSTLDALSLLMIGYEMSHPIHDAGAGIMIMTGLGALAVTRLVAYPINLYISKHCNDTPRNSEPVPNDKYRFGVNGALVTGQGGNGSVGVEYRNGSNVFFLDLDIASNNGDYKGGFVGMEKTVSMAYHRMFSLSPIFRWYAGIRGDFMQRDMYSSSYAPAQPVPVKGPAMMVEPEVSVDVMLWERFPLSFAIGYPLWCSDPDRLGVRSLEFQLKLHGLFFEKSP